MNRNNFFVYSTSQLIQDDKNLKNQYGNIQIYKKAEEEDKIMYQKELQHIITNNPCAISYLNRLQITIGNLDNHQLSRLLSHQFYNPEVMKNMQCLIQENFYTAPWGNVFTPEERARIHLRNVHSFGESSLNSIAYLSNYNAQRDITVVIKEGRNTNADYSLIHEGFVGLYALNNLRQYCPNFMYTYALAKGGAFINRDKKTVAFLNEEHKEVYHLLVESITNSAPMYSFMKEWDGTEFITAFLQVCYALEIAQLQYDFTHYDLHSGNVLMSHKSNEIRQIIYHRPDGTTRYIPTTSIASIIDFGECHVKVNGINYGTSRKKAINTDNVNKQLVDVYKLFGFLSYEYVINKQNNIELEYILSTIWELFDPTVYWKTIVLEQHPLYYNYTKSIVNNTPGSLSLFIDKIEQLLNVKWDIPFDTNTFNCTGNSCYSMQEILQLEKLNKFELPKDIISVYDIYYILLNQKESTAIPNPTRVADEMLNKYTTTPDFIKSYDYIAQLTTKLIYNLNAKLQNNTIPLFSSSALLQNNTLYDSTIFLYIESLQIISDIKFTLHILQFYKSYLTKKYMNELIEYNNYYSILTQKLQKYRPFFNTLDSFLNIAKNKLDNSSWLYINYEIIKNLILL